MQTHKNMGFFGKGLMLTTAYINHVFSLGENTLPFKDKETVQL